MSIRVMLDSDNPAALDGNADIVVTYADLVTDPTAFDAKFPHSLVLYIDRGHGDQHEVATILDVETGLLTPADVPGKLDAMHARGVKYPTVYCNRSTLDAVNQAANGRHFWHWVATLDGTAFIAHYRPLHGPAVIQVLSATDVGAHDDLSLVFESTWNPTGLHVQVGILRRELNGALSTNARLSSELHQIATLIGG